MQTAEDARAIAVKKMDDVRLANERQDSADAQAKTQDRPTTLVARKQQAESDTARAQAARAQADADAARARISDAHRRGMPRLHRRVRTVRGAG